LQIDWQLPAACLASVWPHVYTEQACSRSTSGSTDLTVSKGLLACFAFQQCSNKFTHFDHSSSLGSFSLRGPSRLPKGGPGRGPSVIHSIRAVIHIQCTLKDLVSRLQLACPPHSTFTTAALQHPSSPGAICKPAHNSGKKPPIMKDKKEID